MEVARIAVPRRSSVHPRRELYSGGNVWSSLPQLLMACLCSIPQNDTVVNPAILMISRQQGLRSVIVSRSLPVAGATPFQSILTSTHPVSHVTFQSLSIKLGWRCCICSTIALPSVVDLDDPQPRTRVVPRVSDTVDGHLHPEVVVVVVHSFITIPSLLTEVFPGLSSVFPSL